MKHTLKVTMVILAMFFVSQLIGLGVMYAYAPQVNEIIGLDGQVSNETIYNLPYGMEPPQDVTPKANLVSIIIALVVAIVAMLLFMRINATLFLRLWFFFVVALAIGITLNAALMQVP